MENELNKQILTWWHQLPDIFRTNLPTFIHPLNKKAELLFVGLNPSGDTSAKDVIQNITTDDIQNKIELEKRAIFGDGCDQRNGQYKRYYKPISSIADDLNLEFEHCDLFHMSYRTAKIVVNEIFNATGQLKPIHQEHLSIFNAIFKQVSPKIVITNNVVSANILKEHLQLTFDHQTGLYQDKNGVYFYLNGIMSYGRQTIYDRERLIWQLRKIVESQQILEA